MDVEYPDFWRFGFRANRRLPVRKGNRTRENEGARIEASEKEELVHELSGRVAEG